jgi:hypothetical protein
MASPVYSHVAREIRPRLLALGFRPSKLTFVRRSASRELAISVVIEASRWNVSERNGVPARFFVQVYLFAGREVPDTMKDLLRVGASRANQSPVAVGVWAADSARSYEVGDTAVVANVLATVTPLLALDTVDDALGWLGDHGGSRNFMVAMLLGALGRTEAARTLFLAELANAPSKDATSRAAVIRGITNTAAAFGIVV